MKIEMESGDVLKTDTEYDDNLEYYEFLQAANAGYQALFDWGLFDDFEKKSEYDGYGKAFSFCYTAAINGFITGFIEQTNFQSDYGRLADDEAFNMFLNDCDLYGTDFESFFADKRLTAGLFGHVGILVDQFSGGRPADLLSKGIYPYLTAFTPIEMLARNVYRSEVNNRPVLGLVKLKQGDPDSVLVWSDEEFQTWINTDPTAEKYELVPEKSGANGLLEVPLVYFFNRRATGSQWKGESNVADIAVIDANMARDAVRVESLMMKAAFPMLLLPNRPYNTEEKSPEIKIGVSQVLGYDPETGAKPEWMSPQVASAIEPMLKLWEKKEATIFSIAGLSAIMTAGNSMSARSGESLRELTKFLDAKLAKSVTAELEARRNVIRLWCKWQNKEELFEDVNITHDYKFSTTDFITSVADIMTEKSLLSKSGTAQKELLKKLIQIGTLSDIEPETFQAISEEIDGADFTATDMPTGESVLNG